MRKECRCMAGTPTDSHCPPLGKCQSHLTVLSRPCHDAAYPSSKLACSPPMRSTELQPSVSSVSAQGSPSYLDSRSTGRIFSRTPPPHSAEQADQPSHSPMTQSMGHGCVLQLSFNSIGGQAMPLTGCTKMERVFVRVPPPQEAEHLPPGNPRPRNR